MKSKYIYRSLIISLVCALFMSEASAGLLNRLLYMMMRNRRRHYVPFPVSLSPFSNFGASSSLGGMYPLSLSSLSNSITPSTVSAAAAAAAAAIPYSQYLSNLAGYSSLTPVSPLGPWGGINPYYSYLNLADYPEYARSLQYPTVPNYLPLPTYTPPIYTPPTFPALNISDIKDNDKKISARAAAAAASGSTSGSPTGLAYNIQGQDRKELLSKLKYLANHRPTSNYITRSPILFPESDDLIDPFR